VWGWRGMMIGLCGTMGDGVPLEGKKRTWLGVNERFLKFYTLLSLLTC